jgi:hypothetical protein
MQSGSSWDIRAIFLSEYIAEKQLSKPNVYLCECEGIDMKEHFYRQVYVTKVLGGKRSLWQARMNESPIDPTYGLPSNVCGAGNTADNAIKDLAEQMRRFRARTNT